MKTKFIKKESPDGFENRAVLTSLSKAVGRGSEVRSSI